MSPESLAVPGTPRYYKSMTTSQPGTRADAINVGDFLSGISLAGTVTNVKTVRGLIKLTVNSGRFGYFDKWETLNVIK